jgi:hypothetical protein
MGECVLRAHVRGLGIECDEDECLFWSQLGPEGADATPQCAVSYFQLLGGRGGEIAEWLLGLKERTDIASILGLDREDTPAG